MKRVVIVEDEKLVLLGIESLFETNTKYHVVGSFSRAGAALDSIDALDPDIIMTDIKMPGMDGLEFHTQAAGEEYSSQDSRSQLPRGLLDCFEGLQTRCTRLHTQAPTR